MSITFTSCKKDDPKPEVKNTRMHDYQPISYGSKDSYDPSYQAGGYDKVPEFKNSDIQYLKILEKLKCPIATLLLRASWM